MVDAELVEDRRVEVVDVDDVLDRVVAEVVGLAVADAALDAAARHPDREALDVVVTAVALGHRRATELAAPDDERFVEHPALLEVRDQGSARLIDFLRDPRDAVSHAAVMIPVAVIELDEPHAVFGEASRQ